MSTAIHSPIHRVEHNGALIALVLRSGFNEPGVTFLTPDDFSQQLAFQRRPVGDKVSAHFHNPAPRSVDYTLEVLMLRRGKLRVDLYTSAGEYIYSVVLGQGDTILLASGGHGLEVLEEVELVEVKQGPYLGLGDKTGFVGVNPDLIRIR